jgi:hypothetical protein
MSESPFSRTLHAPLSEHHADKNGAAIPRQRRTRSEQERVATAVVYCEANFGAIDGKTANGLVRQSEKYKILSVIDSEKAGLDSGVVLDDKPNDIPIYRNLADALAHAGSTPDYFIFGMAPASGLLSSHERGLVLEAMDLGMNIVNGLHEFLNDDPVFAALNAANSASSFKNSWRPFTMFIPRSMASSTRPRSCDDNMPLAGAIPKMK